MGAQCTKSSSDDKFCDSKMKEHKLDTFISNAASGVTSFCAG